MPETDSAASQAARISDPKDSTVPAIADTYLRGQLEKRRASIRTAISTIPATDGPDASAPFFRLLRDVESAIHRMDDGTYGICDVCHETVEADRLFANPLVTVCLDHLNSEEQRALERDLELAAGVQRGLLPKTDVRFREWRVHYNYKPAGIVSGDYCDVIPAAGADGNLIFLLGDVAGKGVAASLLMTHLHAMFRVLAATAVGLDGLLATANRMLCQNTVGGQYATLICGRAGHSGEIEIASAGHFPVLHASKHGVNRLAATGLPLGMFETSSYTVHRVHLDPQDSLLLYTDGISEARDSDGEEYGIECLSRAIGGRHGWDPQALVAACLADVQRHSSGRPQADDQTVMVIQRAAAGAAFND